MAAVAGNAPIDRHQAAALLADDSALIPVRAIPHLVAFLAPAESTDTRRRAAVAAACLCRNPETAGWNTSNELVRAGVLTALSPLLSLDTPAVLRQAAADAVAALGHGTRDSLSCTSRLSQDIVSRAPELVPALVELLQNPVAGRVEAARAMAFLVRQPDEDSSVILLRAGLIPAVVALTASTELDSEVLCGLAISTAARLSHRTYQLVRRVHNPFNKVVLEEAVNQLLEANVVQAFTAITCSGTTDTSEFQDAFNGLASLAAWAHRRTTPPASSGQHTMLRYFQQEPILDSVFQALERLKEWTTVKYRNPNNKGQLRKSIQQVAIALSLLLSSVPVKWLLAGRQLYHLANSFSYAMELKRTGFLSDSEAMWVIESMAEVFFSLPNPSATLSSAASQLLRTGAACDVVHIMGNNTAFRERGCHLLFDVLVDVVKHPWPVLLTEENLEDHDQLQQGIALLGCALADFEYLPHGNQVFAAEGGLKYSTMGCQWYAYHAVKALLRQDDLGHAADECISSYVKHKIERGPASAGGETQAPQKRIRRPRIDLTKEVPGAVCFVLSGKSVYMDSQIQDVVTQASPTLQEILAIHSHQGRPIQLGDCPDSIGQDELVPLFKACVEWIVTGSSMADLEQDPSRMWCIAHWLQITALQEECELDAAEYLRAECKPGGVLYIGNEADEALDKALDCLLAALDIAIDDRVKTPDILLQACAEALLCTCQTACCAELLMNDIAAMEEPARDRVVQALADALASKMAE